MKNYRHHLSRVLCIAAALVIPSASFAQEATQAASGSYFSNALFNTLLAVIIILAIMVVALGGALKNVIASDFFIDRLKKEKEQKNQGVPKITGLTILFLLFSLSAFAEEKVAVIAKDDRIGGLDKFTFYTMLVTIGIELLVMGILFNIFKTVLGTKKAEVKVKAELKPKTKTILDKLNDTVEIENEESIMLDHDYDGIRELDNNLPPWWKYGFYLTIVVAVVYMINYHIAKTSPLQKEEYTNSLKKAEADIAEYMKTSANNVDESTVKMLTEPAEIAAGKELFIANCAACHGKFGEGTVGPNLTDDYWLHSGGVKDIFKTIKYGWPDKGMKAWKEDFSPIQIAQITSFIRILKGTNPPKPKDKQGELYVDQDAPADSSKVVADTAKVLASGLPK